MICEFWCNGQLIGTMDATPVCGEDYCACCGDCLACYGGSDNEYCSAYWVKEVADIEEARRIAREYGAIFVQSTGEPGQSAPAD